MKTVFQFAAAVIAGLLTLNGKALSEHLRSLLEFSCNLFVTERMVLLPAVLVLSALIVGWGYRRAAGSRIKAIWAEVRGFPLPVAAAGLFCAVGIWTLVSPPA